MADKENNLEQSLRSVIEGLAIGTRDEALRVLARLTEAGIVSFEGMLSSLRKEETPVEVRSIIYWFLGRVHDSRAISILHKAINEESDESPVWEIAKSLALISDKASVEPLILMSLNSPSAVKRAAAVYALGSLFDPKTIKCLIQILNNYSEDANIRGRAAESLGLLEAKEALGPLLNALNDQSVEVRFWSVYALGRLNDKKALLALKRLSATDDATLEGWWSVREEASEVVKQMEGANSADDS